MVQDGVDPRFRRMGRQAMLRRRRSRGLRLGAAAIVVAALCWGGLRLWQPDLSRLAALWPSGDMDQQLVQVEAGFDIAPVVRRDTFADIPGDPLIIPAPEADRSAERTARVVPPDLAAEPRLAGQGATVTLLDSPLMPRDRQLVPSLPSTREEFALFRAERSRGRLAPDGQAPASPPEARATSSVAFLRDDALRQDLWRETIVEISRPAGLAEILSQNGFDEAEARRLAERASSRLTLPDTLPQGAVLGLRHRDREGRREVIQMSIYDAQGLVGALALSAAGQLVPAADPWSDAPLSLRVADRGDAGEAGGRQRLLDLIYAAALRNDLSPELVGRATALMARVHDLDSPATPEDRLTMVLAGEGDRMDPDGILYIGISGPEGERSCYVVPSEEDGEEGCFVPTAPRAARVAAALSPPISGVLTQRFVPPAGQATDPARARVVWSAPLGTVVAAAGDGRVEAVRRADGLVTVDIAHENGFLTRYDGLDDAPDIPAEGASLRRGQPIGRLGARAGAEPGLGLQLLSGGVAIDPVPQLGGVSTAVGSDAVESLIGRIITVESAGNARARNPLSTATGLGQFIESTWLRMVASYRPDLIASLDRRALLDLRFDPDLSRQMVRHLAQENEAFLRQRGHAITAGRLYLAHFLGPAGADAALRADPQAGVLQVMGPAVVGANPFLRGYSIGDLRAWADRKMAGQPIAAAMAASPEPVPEPVRTFMAAIDRIRADRDG
ncbi:M23 family metallopeptidase [Paracoccus sp. ME4]|uniref:M23 family metallopeptidase n=1 Tax=Paracoccus sp. ME4 TaxID=3138066 RepID=UPI00398B270A